MPRPSLKHWSRFKRTIAVAIGIVCVFIAACAPPSDGSLQGEIKIDGSSTVYLITEALATTFKTLHPDVNVTVGISGTGGGFKKLAAGEIDIADASRRITPDEAAHCAKNHIEFHEIQIAWDGLAVVIHPDNTWAKQMTVEQLKKIWHPDSKAKKWSDVDPAWPAETIKLYGPGPDSGTFDYFTEAVNGKERVTRKDYNASEDDNVLIQGISRNKDALGYLGLAYYEANKGRLGIVAVAPKNGEPFVTPTTETVLTNAYKPLSRPLYLYIRSSSLGRPAVRDFAEFCLRRLDLIEASKYVPLSAWQVHEQTLNLKAAIAGR